jgi:hypothetical protein
MTERLTPEEIAFGKSLLADAEMNNHDIERWNQWAWSHSEQMFAAAEENASLREQITRLQSDSTAELLKHRQERDSLQQQLRLAKTPSERERYLWEALEMWQFFANELDSYGINPVSDALLRGARKLTEALAEKGNPV